MPTVDRFLSHLGDPGRYQVIIMILMAANCIPVVVNHLLMAFYVPFKHTSNHNCRVPEKADKSLWLPPQDNSSSPANSTNYAQCQMYKDPNDHSLGTQACVDGYEFHMEGNEWNVISEWGLVCDREFVGPLITTTYFCGVMLGGIIFGSFSDKFGRKNIMLICLYTQCVIGIALHFVRRLVVFMGLRCIQGVFIQGLQCVTYSMVMELFSRKYRAMAGCVIEAFWAFGVILLALIAKYVQHWRYIQLAINIPTVATIFYIWIVPESVRWLLSRGKFTRAEAIVGIIASNNSLKLDPIWLREEMEEVGRIVVLQVPDRYPDIRDLMTNKGIRRHAFVLFFVWFSVSLSYYGISFSIPDLSGDRYLNFMIGGGIELAAYILAFVFVNSFGRKYPLMLYLFLSGILCISVVCVRRFVPAEAVNVESLATALALIGKASVVSCFCIIFIYSSEVFPTVIRTVGVGVCAFFGRVGSLLAPQILHLGKKLMPLKPDVVTFITFGVLSIIACLLALILPETGDEDLPDTVFEAENLGDNPDKNCQKQASNYNDDTLVRSEDFGAQQSQYSTHSTEAQKLFEVKDEVTEL